MILIGIEVIISNYKYYLTHYLNLNFLFFIINVLDIWEFKLNRCYSVSLLQIFLRFKFVSKRQSNIHFIEFHHLEFIFHLVMKSFVEEIIETFRNFQNQELLHFRLFILFGQCQALIIKFTQRYLYHLCKNLQNSNIQSKQYFSSEFQIIEIPNISNIQING